MKKAVLIVLLLTLAAWPLQAKINSFDRVPGATLLLPYFEVDLQQPGVVATTFTIGNSGNTEVVAHVTLWSDAGAPTQTFDVRLAAQGVAEVDLGALFWYGTLPQSTAGSFGSCSATLPPAPLGATALTNLRNAHLGLASPVFDADDVVPVANDECGGRNYGDNRVRGFATVDVTGACTTLNPKSAGYFVNGGNGVARNTNVLWGEYSSYFPPAGLSFGEALVSLEADASDPLTNGDVPEDYTFYRRMTGSNADNREALPQAWSARFANAGTFTHTRAVIWRDPPRNPTFPCASPTVGIATSEAVVFDEMENPAATADPDLHLATQAVELADTTAIDVPVDNGFVRYGLNSLSSPSDPSEAALADRRQSYVTHILRTASSGGQITGNALAAIDDPVLVLLPGGGGVSTPQCSDGVDNDGDGFVDYPNDPECWSATDMREAHSYFVQCSNMFDDDADTKIDFPADPECSNRNDNTENAAGGPYFPPNNTCDDGLDNDHDGLTDFGSDPNCFGYPFWNAEGGFCSDGIDNDGDGKIDFGTGAGNDKGCSSFFDNDETNGPCVDGIDNDGDGKIDFPADPGCSSMDGIENPECNDGVDNDGDTKIDYPADTGCLSPSYSFEQNAACNDGIDNDGDGKIDYPADPGCASLESGTEAPACSNGSDDDGDGYIDYPADRGCTSPAGTGEWPYNTVCSDGVDNDGDGMIDAPNDTGCSSSGDSFEGPDCSDGVDNDGDGFTDLADPGCANGQDNNEFAGSTTRQCSDGIDNDGDGFRDYPQDTGCQSRYDDNEYVTGQAAAVASATIPALSPLGMVIAAALLALVAVIALRGTSLG